MQIFVKTLTGKTLTFEIDGSATLRDLKIKVQKRKKVRPDDQRFIYAGSQLFNEDGSIFDEIDEILRRCGREPIKGDHSDITLHLVERLRGGGNRIYHRPRPVFASLSDSESDDDDQFSGSGQIGRNSSSDQSPDQLPRNGISSSNLALVQYSSNTSLSKNRLKKFGFGSSKTTYPPLEAPSMNEKGFGFEEIKENGFEKVKRTTEGGLGQVLYEIPPSMIEHIRGKETNVLYCEGIDQIIQGMYSLQQFRSRVESEKQMALSEQMPQIEDLIRMVSMTQFALDRSNKEVLELREERSELKNEIANLKKLANDVGNQSYDRGYERAVKDIEECIASEHPEWDLSFIQS